MIVVEYSIKDGIQNELNDVTCLQYKIKLKIQILCYKLMMLTAKNDLPVSNLFLVSYTKSSAVRSSVDSSGCQKSIITTYLSSEDLLSTIR